MISDHHKEQQKLIRAQDDQEHPNATKWGSSGHRNFGYMFVNYLARAPQINTILDYGSGHGTLKDYIDANLERKLDWTQYDPGMPDIDELPTGSFDLIVSSDVLEHVEPDDIDDTMNWFDAHSKCQYHYISGNHSSRLMADGRSVHLIVESYDWWIDKFTRPGWEIQFSSFHKGRKRAHTHLAYGIMTQKL